MLTLCERVFYRLSILRLLGFGIPSSKRDFIRRAWMVRALRVLSLVLLTLLWFSTPYLAAKTPFSIYVLFFAGPLGLFTALVWTSHGNSFYAGGLIFIVCRDFSVEPHDWFVHSDSKKLYRDLFEYLPLVSVSGASHVRITTHMLGEDDEAKLLRKATRLIQACNDVEPKKTPRVFIAKLTAKHRSPPYVYYPLLFELWLKRKKPRSRNLGTIEIAFMKHAASSTVEGKYPYAGR